ncbi:MAG: hypothetical protein ABJE95_24175 [Byssovorax sp.]
MFTQLLKTLSAGALLGAAALAGCSTATTSSTASELTGSIDQATFPAVVTSITVARDDGTTALAPVLADGTFSALLESGGTYRLLLSADGTGTPVVLDVGGGRLRTEIQVTSGGGAVALGSIRYWDPSVGSKGQALTKTTVVAAPVAPTCTNGVVAGTSQPCAGTTAAVDCSVANDMSNGCPDLGATDPTAPSGATAATSVNDASAAKPMGVPAANAPTQITCGGHDHHGGPSEHGGHGHGH